MAREIKFRGKTVPDGRWVYGYYVVMENETKTVTRHAIMDLLDKDNQYIKDGKSYHMSVSVVDAETVGQFTGLHDKNGKEIYEGDIICSPRGNKHYIVYDENNGSYAAVKIGNKPEDGMCSITKYWIEHYEKEVIGNIYDNPEIECGGD